MSALSLSFVSSLLISNFSHANLSFEPAGASNCESLLSHQLHRRPDDLRNGLVTDQVPVTAETVLAAYRLGIFPWGVSNLGLGRWYSPTLRGILLFDELKISRSDRKFLRKALESGEYEITFNKDFPAVIQACAEQPRYSRGHSGLMKKEKTWISREIVKAYSDLHQQGHAHSVEIWRKGKLVAGLYGVYVDGVFSGESMFHKEPDAAKLAMLTLIERLRAGGHTFMDTQMSVGLSEKWGSRLVHRTEFEKLVRTAHNDDTLEF